MRAWASARQRSQRRLHQPVPELRPSRQDDLQKIVLRIETPAEKMPRQGFEVGIGDFISTVKQDCDDPIGIQAGAQRCLASENPGRLLLLLYLHVELS